MKLLHFDTGRWDTSKSATREQFFEVVQLSREAVTKIDALPGSYDADQERAIIHEAQYLLQWAGLDRESTFVFDDECKRAWAVYGDLNEAHMRFYHRRLLLCAIGITVEVEWDLHQLHVTASRYYRKAL